MNFDPPFVDVRVRRQPLPLRSSHVLGRWLPAFLLLALVLPPLLLLDGCASSSRGGYGTGYSEQPPTNRTAYVAYAEWTKFGRSTVVYGGSANGYTNRDGVSERSEPLASRVGDYWGSCGHPEWNGYTAGRPWSGAFVAWVMSHSGVSAADFPRVGRHGSYLATLFDHERAGRTAFLLHAPNEYAAKPGDLVCSGTQGASWRYSDPRMARRRIDATANHCDVVAYVRQGYVYAIGGNVKDSVTMSVYPADQRGHLVPSGGHPWMMVVENRLN